MGKEMAGINEFALFRCRSISTGGVQNQAENNSKMPSGRYRYENLLFQRSGVFWHTLRGGGENKEHTKTQHTPKTQILGTSITCVFRRASFSLFSSN